MFPLLLQTIARQYPKTAAQLAGASLIVLTTDKLIDSAEKRTNERKALELMQQALNDPPHNFKKLEIRPGESHILEMFPGSVNIILMLSDSTSKETVLSEVRRVFRGQHITWDDLQPAHEGWQLDLWKFLGGLPEDIATTPPSALRNADLEHLLLLWCLVHLWPPLFRYIKGSSSGMLLPITNSYAKSTKFYRRLCNIEGGRIFFSLANHLDSAVCTLLGVLGVADDTISNRKDLRLYYETGPEMEYVYEKDMSSRSRKRLESAELLRPESDSIKTYITEIEQLTDSVSSAIELMTFKPIITKDIADIRKRCNQVKDELNGLFYSALLTVKHNSTDYPYLSNILSIYIEQRLTPKILRVDSSYTRSNSPLISWCGALVLAPLTKNGV